MFKRVFTKISSTKTLCTALLFGLFKLFGMFPVFAILIILFSFLRIAQHFIGFVYLLKLAVSLFIIWVQVGMQLACQFAICFLYVIGRSVFINAQCFIIINKIHFLY